MAFTFCWLAVLSEPSKLQLYVHEPFRIEEWIQQWFWPTRDSAKAAFRQSYKLSYNNHRQSLENDRRDIEESIEFLASHEHERHWKSFSLTKHLPSGWSQQYSQLANIWSYFHAWGWSQGPGLAYSSYSSTLASWKGRHASNLARSKLAAIGRLALRSARASSKGPHSCVNSPRLF